MTTNRFEALARRLVLGLGLGLGLGVGGAGCEAAGGPISGPTEEPQAPAPTEAPAAPSRAALEAEGEADLARLRALQIVEVRGLRLPDQKTYCYGNPCAPGAAWDHRLDVAYAQIVPRLTRMTEAAETLARDASIAASDGRTAAVDIASLDAMGVVELGALLTVAPANNPSCYSLPCPEDEQKAAQTNARKAGIVHAWKAEIVARKL